MPSQIQSKNVDFCCAIFSCVCLHSERYKTLYIKRSFEVILYHIAGETGTKHRIVEQCVFNRTRRLHRRSLRLPTRRKWAQSGYLCTTPSTAQAGADAGFSWS